MQINPHDIDVSISVCKQCGKSLKELHENSKGMYLECTGFKGTVHIGYLQRLRVFNKFIDSQEIQTISYSDIRNVNDCLRPVLKDAVQTIEDDNDV